MTDKIPLLENQSLLNLGQFLSEEKLQMLLHRYIDDSRQIAAGLLN